MNKGHSPIPPIQIGVADDATNLSHPKGLSKLGVKGPKLMEWARAHGIELPSKLYDVQPVSEHGLFARVGNDEIILECTPDDELMAKFERILQQPTAGVYRIEQQTVTIELTGEHAHPILAQTCGVNFSCEPAQRIVYTRVAGASCGVIVRQKDEQRIYRIWVDYSLAVYLWDCFCEIIKYLEDRQNL